MLHFASSYSWLSGGLCDGYLPMFINEFNHIRKSICSLFILGGDNVQLCTRLSMLMGWLCTYSNYEKLVLDKAPEIVRSCIQFLQSEAFFLIMSNLTGLRLHRLAVTSPDTDEEDEPSSADVGQGIYTLFVTVVYTSHYLCL